MKINQQKIGHVCYAASINPDDHFYEHSFHTGLGIGSIEVAVRYVPLNIGASFHTPSPPIEVY